jgi:hypothetical protein
MNACIIATSDKELNNYNEMTDRQIVSEKKAEPIYILLAVICFICASVFTSDAQEIDILLKGGHVIDPKNEINSPMDVAIIAGKISQVAVNIPSTEAKKIVDVSGMGNRYGRYI